MQNIVEKVVDILIKNGLSITTAESCTGGLIASSIVSVSNASKVFNEAYVTYANSSKIKLLGVSQKSIDKYGVVSEVVTREMAIGAAKNSNADVSLVSSGIAGPTGGSLEKPVGTVCFGIFLKGKIYTYTKKFGNLGRNVVREKSKDYILTTLHDLLTK